MDSVQKQVIALNHKVDEIYQSIEQLTLKVSEALSENRQISPNGKSDSPIGTSNGRYSYQQSTISSMMEHKDVLIDAKSCDEYSQHSEKELSPEIQIQRLTAQLTAAYNRIAALEEQLLSRRIHSSVNAE